MMKVLLLLLFGFGLGYAENCVSKHAIVISVYETARYTCIDNKLYLKTTVKGVLSKEATTVNTYPVVISNDGNNSVMEDCTCVNGELKAKHGFE